MLLIGLDVGSVYADDAGKKVLSLSLMTAVIALVARSVDGAFAAGRSGEICSDDEDRRTWGCCSRVIGRSRPSD
jgi:hypothetical protein